MRTASKKDNIIQSSRRFPVRAIKPAGTNNGSSDLAGQKPFNRGKVCGRGLIIAQGVHPGKWALRKSRLFPLRPSIAAAICEQNARSLLAMLT
jgi:hypothetical protein